MKTIPNYIGTLENGKHLELPEDAITQVNSILGKRGKGKSNLLAVMLETFWKRGQSFVVLDPPAAHWGIRYAVDEDGKPTGPSGIDVLIIGGEPVNVSKFSIGEAVERLKKMFASKQVERRQEVADLAEAKKRIKELERAVTAQARTAGVPKSVELVPRRVDQKAVERAVRQVRAEAEKSIVTVHADAKAMRAHGGRLAKALADLATAAAKQFGTQLPEIPKLSVPKIAGGEIQRKVPLSHGVPEAKATRTPHDHSNHRPDASSEGLSRPRQRVLGSLAEFAGIGIEAPSRSMVASWLGVKAGTGSFKNYLSELRVLGLISDPKPDCIALTAEGSAAAPEIRYAVSTDELLDRSAGVLGSTTAKILRIIHNAHPGFVSRETVADELGISAETGSFKNYISELRVAGMIEDGANKSVKAADWLFI